MKPVSAASAHLLVHSNVPASGQCNSLTSCPTAAAGVSLSNGALQRQDPVHQHCQDCLPGAVPMPQWQTCTALSSCLRCHDSPVHCWHVVSCPADCPCFIIGVSDHRDIKADKAVVYISSLSDPYSITSDLIPLGSSGEKWWHQQQQP